MEGSEFAMFCYKALLKLLQDRCPYELLAGQRSDSNGLGYEARMLSDLQLNYNFHLEEHSLENVEASASRNTMDLHGLLQGQL
jgi:hypothetical protein